MTRNTRPGIGPPDDPRRVGLCGYSGVDPGVASCLDEAMWHGYTADLFGLPVHALSSCDRHKPIMDTLAAWVHVHDTACGLEESVFNPELNACLVPLTAADLSLTVAEPIGAAS